MIYFSKIEAYFAGELTDAEQTVFEQALAEDSVLQQEYAAYETAQSIFGFTADQLSTSAIIAPEAEEIAEELISFTANNLSEAQILGTSSEVTIMPLQVKRNRTAWLVAASMLFLLGLAGLNFYNQSSNNSVTSSSIAQTNSANPVSPLETKKIEKVQPTAPSLAANVLTATKQKKQPLTNKKATKKTYTPTETVVKSKSTAISTYVIDNSPAKNQVNPTSIKQSIATNSSAQEITTQAVIDDAQSIVYSAEKVITLKPGFHAEAGTSFTAKTKTSSTSSTDLATATIVKAKEAVVFRADNSITLKPGFHAKAGSEFLAAVQK